MTELSPRSQEPAAPAAASAATPDAQTQQAVSALARIARMLERHTGKSNAGTSNAGKTNAGKTDAGKAGTAGAGSASPITLADFRILSAVYGGESRASRLAQRLAVGKPSLSATVDSLVRRGLLERRRHANDQRALELTVTAEGCTALARAQHNLGALVASLAAHTADPAATIACLAGLDEAIEAEVSARATARAAARSAAGDGRRRIVQAGA